jgi:hypothetical protein
MLSAPSHRGYVLCEKAPLDPTHRHTSGEAERVSYYFYANIEFYEVRSAKEPEHDHDRRHVFCRALVRMQPYARYCAHTQKLGFVVRTTAESARPRHEYASTRRGPWAAAARRAAHPQLELLSTLSTPHISCPYLFFPPTHPGTSPQSLAQRRGTPAAARMGALTNGRPPANSSR